MVFGVSDAARPDRPVYSSPSSFVGFSLISFIVLTISILFLCFYIFHSYVSFLSPFSRISYFFQFEHRRTAMSLIYDQVADTLGVGIGGVVVAEGKPGGGGRWGRSRRCEFDSVPDLQYE